MYKPIRSGSLNLLLTRMNVGTFGGRPPLVVESDLDADPTGTPVTGRSDSQRQPRQTSVGVTSPLGLQDRLEPRGVVVVRPHLVPPPPRRRPLAPTCAGGPHRLLTSPRPPFPDRTWGPRSSGLPHTRDIALRRPAHAPGVTSEWRSKDTQRWRSDTGIPSSDGSGETVIR